MGKVKIGAMIVLDFYVLKNIALKYLKENDGEYRKIVGRKLRKQSSRGEFYISFSVFEWLER